MTQETLQIIDPEYLLPSPASALSPEFWARMLDRASDHVSRIGPATLEGLLRLIEMPASSRSLAERDFWKIVQHFMSRGFDPSASPRTVCPTHFAAAYSPLLGDPDNADRLREDTQAAGGHGPLALSTIDEVWSSRATTTCTACDRAPVVRVTPTMDELSRENSIAQAWRSFVVEMHPGSVSAVALYAPEMFPRLTFHPNAWSRVGSLQGDDAENAPRLVRHLSALNDKAAEIWASETDTIRRQGAMGSVGATCSPESPNTRRSTKKMKHRDFVFGAKKVRCEWHTKLRPNVNRIHFAVENQDVYIGTIVDHLPV